MDTSVIKRVVIKSTSIKGVIESYVVFGGTFDPVHNGHLSTAQALAETMAYECVHIMPCGDAYHKAGSSSATHRLAMLKLALLNTPILKLDSRETLRSGATYTVDTLRALRRELGELAHITWVLGTDAAAGLCQWQNWQQVFTLANVLVVARAGENSINLQHWPAVELSDKTEFKKQPHGCYMHLVLPPVELSSSQVRDMVKNNQVVDNHVPQLVIEYIEQHGLYRENHSNGCSSTK